MTKEAKNSMRAADREALRKALESKRAQLLRSRTAVVEAATHSDDQLVEPMDAAERATEESELLGLADQERVLLEEIDHALSKFADGTYGLSEASGRPISIERLRAVPWARRTADEEESRG